MPGSVVRRLRAGLYIVWMLGGAAAWAAPQTPVLRLNDTGSTLCRSSEGRDKVDCRGSGQDGQYGRDARRGRAGDGAAGFAFTRVCHSGELAGAGNCPAMPVLGTGPNDWGCTKDKVTGLTWEIKTADEGLRDWRRRFRHLGTGAPDDDSAYLAAVNAAGLCGAQDWRLPVLTELQGIVHYGLAQPGPVLDAPWWPLTAADGHWTATHGQQPDAAWAVDFRDGSTRLTDARFGRAMAVRLVRGPLAVAPAERFQVQAQEVLDRFTGLVWRRCAEGQVPGEAGCEGRATRMNWRHALRQAQALSTASGQAWRLPNAKELESIVAHDATGVLIDLLAFPGTQPGRYWTATPWAYNPDPKRPQTWVMDFGEGWLWLAQEFHPLMLRLVRNAE